MAERAIARRYAKAFMELAEDHDAVDALGDDLGRALSAFHANDDQLFSALSNPVFTTEERRAVLEAVVPKIGVQELTRNLLYVLLEKGRFAALPEVKAVYDDLADERAGRVRVQVRTAEPLSPQLEAEVRAAFERITGKSVTLQTQVDPSLIGGLVARVGSRVYDASIKNRLQMLRQEILSQHEPAEA